MSRISLAIPPPPPPIRCLPHLPLHSLVSLFGSSLYIIRWWARDFILSVFSAISECEIGSSPWQRRIINSKWAVISVLCRRWARRVVSIFNWVVFGLAQPVLVGWAVAITIAVIGGSGGGGGVDILCVIAVSSTRLLMLSGYCSWRVRYSNGVQLEIRCSDNSNVNMKREPFMIGIQCAFQDIDKYNHLCRFNYMDGGVWSTFRLRELV